MTALQSIDWGTKVTPTGGVISVYFATNGETYDGVTSQGWTAYEISQAMQALAAYSAVLNVTFSQVSSPTGADFKLVTTTNQPFAGYFNPPGTLNAGVGVFSTDVNGWDTTGGLEPGGFGFMLLLHEFGHGMGLAHPHDTGGTSPIMPGVTSDQGDYGDYGLNQGIYTNMSYNDGWPDGPNGGSPSTSYGIQGSLMALDIASLQADYGANTTANAGDNVYTLASVNANGTFYAAIWDTGGTDTIVNTSATGSTIDLRAASLADATGGGGFVSNVSGIHGGFTIANSVIIENATGGSGNDTLIGNATSNILNGGAGTDTVSYAHDPSALVINLISQTASSISSGNDILVSIENAIGGWYDDYIYGDNLANRLEGRGGNDVLVAGDGNDTIYGNEGDDWLYGQDGNDTIRAGSGNVDVSQGGDGADTVFGEDGFDYLYGQAGADTLNGGNGIDVLYGGTDNDTLNGDADTDWLFGGDGSDGLNGGDNADLMFGEAGADTINAGSGNDWIWGGTSNGLGDGAADIFAFGLNWGADVIYDFENGTDRIDLSATGASSFSDLAIGQITGGFTWISNGTSVIYLWGAGNVNVGVSNIDASDFIF